MRHGGEQREVNDPSVGDEVDQFAQRKTRTSSSEDTGRPDQPDGRTVGPLGFTHSSRLRKGVFVKAAYGKTVRAVWAADGGQRACAPPPTRQQ